ncbi:MAG: hypothetical protein ACOZIN_20610 [Myxococcota bacterium]
MDNSAPALHSERQLRHAAYAIYAVAALDGVLALAALATRSAYLEQRLHLGWGTLVLAALLGLLGFLAERRSLFALALALGLTSLEALAFALRAVSAGGPLWPVILRLFLLLYIAQGVGAVRSLRGSPR